ncbi:hypothetical protein Tco_0351223 [Tanacetum coccineum]
MLCATLKLLVETPEQPFIPPASLEYIQPFLKIVGYQGLVDKVSAFFTKNLAQPWQTMFKQKKNVIQYPRFTKLIIADIMAIYESIHKRLEEDYHLIKDDTPLVNVYTTGKVNDYVEKYEGVEVLMIQPELVESTQRTNRTPRATSTPNPIDVVQKKKGKRAARETSSPIPSLKVRIRHQKPSTAIPPPSDDRERDEIHEATLRSLPIHKTAKIAEEQENVAIVEKKILEEDVEKIVEEPRSHKDKPKNINDDVDDEMKDDKDDDDDDDDHDDHALIRNRRTGSLEIRNKKMQTTIPSPPRSLKKDLSSNKAIDQELTVSVTPTPIPATSSQRLSKPISRRYTHIPRALKRICRRQGFMIQQMEKKYVTNRDFQGIKEKVDEVLHDIVTKISSNATNNLIDDNLPRIVANVVKKERKLHKLL